MGFGVFEPGPAGGLVSSSQQAKEKEEELEEEKEKSWVLTDMDGFEAGVCAEEVTVVVRGNRKGRGMEEVLKIEKGGGGVLGREGMRQVVGLARERWEGWRKMVEGS